jgi:hypothetical protein
MQCLGLAPISQRAMAPVTQLLSARFQANLGAITRHPGILKIRQVGFSRQGFGKDFYKIIYCSLLLVGNPCFFVLVLGF